MLVGSRAGTNSEWETLHKVSRRKGVLMAINGALIESELFGYERGAFTGANTTKVSKNWKTANKGTVFLDEIAEMSPAAQAKLLRVLQEREFQRVGGIETLKVDVRIIASTNRDLKQRMTQKFFLPDFP